MILPAAGSRHSRSLELTVSWATLLKLTAYAVIIFVALKLLHFIGLLFVALLIATTLAPLAGGLCRRGAPKWLSIFVCALLLFGSVGLFFFVVTPVAAGQINGLIKSLPNFKDHILQRLPEAGELRGLAEGVLNSAAFSNPDPLLQRFMAWGALALQGLVELFVMLIIALYLVADGSRVYQWLVAFLPERQQARVALASREMSAVVFSYMGGQLITSALCGIYIWTVLSLLGVPNALLMAIIGGVFDVLPLIGFFLALAPAVAMGSAVSPATAGYVIASYVFYHLVENYFIVPRVYGNRLRLSTLTVFVACMAAALVAGVVGVIAVLPIIASYPIFERMWLRPVVGADTVAQHDEIEAKEHPVALHEEAVPVRSCFARAR